MGSAERWSVALKVGMLAMRRIACGKGVRRRRGGGRAEKESRPGLLIRVLWVKVAVRVRAQKAWCSHSFIIVNSGVEGGCGGYEVEEFNTRDRRSKPEPGATIFRDNFVSCG
jgi:hypothetical protein